MYPFGVESEGIGLYCPLPETEEDPVIAAGWPGRRLTLKQFGQEAFAMAKAAGFYPKDGETAQDREKAHANVLAVVITLGQERGVFPKEATVIFQAPADMIAANQAAQTTSGLPIAS